MFGALTKMYHYCTREKDGTIHVQNAVGPYMGQHHVHTAADFETWCKQVDDDVIKWLKNTAPCDCGLKPGEAKHAP